MKSLLRTTTRHARAALTDKEVEQRSQAICNQIIHHPRYQHAQHIACYLACKNEVNLNTVIQHAWQLQKEIYVPIVDQYNNSMHFHAYTEETQLHKNRFGMLEPIITDNQWTPPKQLDLLLIPLIAFDVERNRIGQGAGFYDRYLNQHKTTPITTMGVAYELQKIDAVPTDEWDVTLDLIITERSIY